MDDRTEPPALLSTLPAQGQGLRVRYGSVPGAAGTMLVGRTQWGVCFIGFCPDGDRGKPLRVLKARLPRAVLEENADETGADILAAWRGAGPCPALDVGGTNFQRRVWRTLTAIPCGATRTYAAIAADIGHPTAARAVGNAVGANPVSLLIPCHRVLPASGGTGNYLWGGDVKKALLTAEENLPSLSS